MKASWRALGTEVQLHVVDPSEMGWAAARARSILEEVDQACSRFRADSDLVLANARPGRWTPVSPVLVAAVEVALEAALATDGRVDPGLGLALEAAGYDRTFDLLASAAAQPAALPVQLRPHAWREVGVDGDRLRVPVGVRLDLGATGKAFAADLVAADLAERLSGAVAVSVGGDVAVGVPEGCEPHWWEVVVAETRTDLADRPQDTTTVHLVQGGLATSTVRARHWSRGGRDWHHVLDPRNGLPVGGPWRSATALGHTCSAANTATTAALVLGTAAPEWLADRDVAALLVDEQGRRHATPRWTRAAAPSESPRKEPSA
jgi:thiamine biosynthesis lipoprotein